ncbi:MAG: hypothetical protein QG549_462 [Patescibacteria group bacterium]|nr:hypothetical protein [Patescibacteria group bacterium]
MENTPQGEKSVQGCPLASLNFDASKIVLSTNKRNLRDMRINPIAPAANMRRVTDPNSVEPTDHFVPWFAPDDELARAVQIRKAAYQENPDRVLNTADDDPSVCAVAEQLLELQTEYLVRHYPAMYELDGSVICNKVSGDRYDITPGASDLHPLAIIGLLGQEDVCIVHEQADGRHVMVAGFLASPTGWNLADFIGLDMDQIHENVDGYTEKLKSTVDRSLSSLPEFPERQFARNNTFLGLNPLLGLVHDQMPDIDENSITDAESQIIFRSEYETLTRLPATEKNPNGNQYIIFTIEPRVYALSTMKAERGQDLAKAIETNRVLGRKAIVAKEAMNYLNQ